MVVIGPPRLQGTDESSDRADVEALREQALIEEARRRTRRRRRGYAGIAVVVLAVAAGVGFARGGDVKGALGHDSARSPLAGTAVEGRIAVADGSGALWVVNPDGSELRAGARCPTAESECRIFEPAWSPDGTQLAYVRGPFHLQLGDPRSGLSVYVTDGSGSLRRLAGCGDCGQLNRGRLSWSPDGTQIAFTRPGAGRHQSLWITDSDGHRLRRLTSCAATVCFDVQPAWAPNGQLLAFSRIGSRGSALYTMRPDGSQLTRITTVPGAIDPQWSPDGSKIVFDAAGDKIYVTDLSGSPAKLLVAGSGAGSGPGAPSWSPDGAKLAYFNTPGGFGGFTAEVWTINADGSAPQRVARTDCCVEIWAAPVWSPDGTQIAFAANSAGGTFVVNANGGGLHRLTAANAFALAWQRTR